MKIASVLIFVTALIGCSDQVYRLYNTFNDAINDDVITKGWMPSFYPKSAKNILLVANLDTNIFVIKSEINKGDIGGFVENCTPEPSHNEIRYFDDVNDFDVPPVFRRFKCENESTFVELLNEKHVFYSNNF